MCVCVCVWIISLHRYAENRSQQLGETAPTGGVPGRMCLVTVFRTQQRTAFVFALHIIIIIITRDSIILFSKSLFLNPIKAKINLNYNPILRSSPYRAVNTLRLSCKNQSVNVV